MFPRPIRAELNRPPSHETSYCVVVPSSSATNVAPAPSPGMVSTGFTVAPSSSDSAMTPQQLQRLKVEDALSYLDKVKIKYLYQPDIYNQFLDIMKEFKSQSIDTPGVIRRVSTLFQKDPDLIIGFNTFLPPGFRMEVRGETVVIKQPTGTTVLSGDELSGRSQVVSQTSASPPVFIVQQPQQQQQSQQQQPQVPQQSQQQMSASVVPTSTLQLAQSAAAAAASAQPAAQAQAGGNVQPVINVPVEFNYAINYVNKIKLRFQDRPDVYKQFLEILHRYQKEQKMLREGVIPPGSRFLTEAEVYTEVSRLFTNQQDILEEFGHFLPETTAASGASLLLQSGASLASSASSGSSEGGQASYSNFPTLQAAAVSAVAEQKPLPVSATSKESTDSTAPSAGAGGPGRRKTKPAGAVVKSEGKDADSGETPAVSKKASTAAVAATSKRMRLGPPLQPDLAEAAKYGKLEEIAFFDKLRKAVKSRQVYENFLRCLGVYADEVASKNDLLQMVLPFLRPHPELLRQFKDIMGLIPPSGQKDLSVSVPIPLYAPGGRWGTDPQVEVDYSTLKHFDESESYRVLPPNYPQPKCSGRTALCHEVLNDRYVSFPAWSESSYFVSAKKTQYEETIYRCEDERFELEMVIEINRSAILCLEAVQRKMAKMSSEDAANYRLDNTLGGSSEVIQQKAIQRLYGDRAPEIIEGLKRNPVVAVPIVLRRLKAKDEEWRDAQRAFNKIWREQMRKFYLKSLDHQGINFKQNDMKAIRSKALLNEVEEAFEAAAQTNDGSLDRAHSDPHMTLHFDDSSIIDDATELIVHHAKRQSGLTKDYKRIIKQLLYHFLPDLFHMKRHDFSDSEDETDSENDEPSDDDAAHRAKVSNRQARAQARAQRIEQLKLTGGNLPTGSEGVSAAAEEKPLVEKSETAAMETDEKPASELVPEKKAEEQVSGATGVTNAAPETTAAPTPIPTVVPAVKADQQVDPPHLLPSDINTLTSLFFAGNHWYLFFRLHNLLCCRLQILRQAAHKAIAAAEPADSKNAAAMRLKYKSPPDYEPNQYYAMLLELVRQLLDCNIDSNQFEEQLRQMFGIHAYWGFTLDKIVQHVVKQLQHLVTDESYSQVMCVFHEMVREGVVFGRIIDPAHRQLAEINYERKIVKLLQSENAFRLVVTTGNNGSKLSLGIEIISSDANADPGSALLNWASYVRYYAAPELRLRMSYRRPRFLLRGWRRRALTDQDATESQTPEPIFESGSMWGRMEANNLAADDPKKATMLLWDNEHAIICPRTLRIQYTNDHRMVYFRQGRAVRHDERQKRVALRQNESLQKFISKWESENLSVDQRNETLAWLTDCNGKVVEITAAGSDDAPPYHRYNRYKLCYNINRI